LTDSGNFISYIGICVSFILIFNIFIDYFKYFNGHILTAINYLETRLKKRNKWINDICSTRIRKTKNRFLHKFIFTIKEKSNRSSETTRNLLKFNAEICNDRTHKLIIFFTLTIAIITTQLPFYDNNLKMILEKYNIHPYNDFTGIWILTVVASLLLHFVVYFKNSRGLRKKGIGLSRARHAIHLSFHIIVFLLCLYALHFAQQLFFLNIFIFYFVSLFSVFILLPASEVYLIYFPLITFYAIKLSLVKFVFASTKYN